MNGSSPASRPKVLVLEDRPVIAQFIDEMVAGYAFIFAEPSAATTILECRQIDAVLLEATLPSDVTSKVTEIALNRRLPVVLLGDPSAPADSGWQARPESQTDLLRILRLHIAED